MASSRPQALLRRTMLRATAACGLLAAACRADASRTDDRRRSESSGARPPRSADPVERLLAWAERNPGRAGICVTGADPGVAVSAGAQLPLASAAKVLTLLAAADRVDAGALSLEQPVSAADVERWYVRGTDGGAHEAALRERGGPARTVAELAYDALRWSDNAAHDELLLRAGGTTATARAAAAHGMRAQDALSPFFGELAGWATHGAAWAELPAARRAELAQEAADAAAAGQRPPLRLPRVDVQRRLVATTASGTAGEWAELMHRVGRAAGPEEGWAQRVLEWPLEAFPDNRRRFARFGTKGGSLPGARTNVAYLQPHGGPLLGVAVLLRDLPEDLESELDATFADQELLVRLATDAGTRAEVAERLG